MTLSNATIAPESDTMTDSAEPRRICVVVTARASYARIKTVLHAIQESPRLELQLVVAASALLDRYGAVVDVMRADGFEPNSIVYMVVEGENLITTAKSTGIGIVELSTVFSQLQPDAVISIADRYETIATAIAASFLHIPLVHIQGGEITGSIDEKVRHAVTKLADIHFVSSETARTRVLRMGENPDRVFVTGCPSVDLAAEVGRETPNGFDPFSKYPGVGSAFRMDDEFLVVMQHPVTNEYTDGVGQIEQTLSAVTSIGMPSIWFWPNVDAGSDRISSGIRRYRESNAADNMYFVKNMNPKDFLRLLVRARCLVGNSSVGIRESAYLGTPVVNIGSRQNGRDRAENVINADYSHASIRQALDVHLSRPTRYTSNHLYGEGNAGNLIADLLATVPLTVMKQLTY